MFQAVFKLPASKLSQIPITRAGVTSPYDVIQDMKQFTFPNIAPKIRKFIIDNEEDDDEEDDDEGYIIPYKDLLKVTNENITVRLARNKDYIFLLYRGTVGKIPVGNRCLVLVKDAPIWDSYRFILPTVNFKKYKKNPTEAILDGVDTIIITRKYNQT